MDEKGKGCEGKSNPQRCDKEKGKGIERGKTVGGRPTRAVELSRLREKTGSLESIIDYMRNKRGREEEIEVEKVEKEIVESFNRERRTLRSPPNKMKKEEEKGESTEAERLLKEILVRMEEQERERKKDNEEIKKELQELREEYRRKEMLWEQQKATIENRVKRLEEKLEESEKSKVEKYESNDMQEKVKGMEKHLEMTERRRRKNNIIIKGAKLGNEGERKNKTEKFLGELIKKEVKVEEVHEIGRDEYKMFLVKLGSWKLKREIMLKRKELKKENKIYIEDDLTVAERQIQKHLRDIAKNERENGKKATVGYQKIWVDNRGKKWNENTGKLEDFRG